MRRAARDASARSSRSEDAEELRRAAHTLKSNGATLGAGEFAELCRELEQQRKEGRLDEAPELVARIEQEYRPLERALELAAPAGAVVSGPVAPPARSSSPTTTAMNRLLLGRGLEHQGHTVVFAEHGREALELLRQQPLRPAAARRADARARRLRRTRGAEGRRAPSRHPGDRDVRARRARQRRQVRRDGRRGLPDEADQPGSA